MGSFPLVARLAFCFLLVAAEPLEPLSGLKDWAAVLSVTSHHDKPICTFLFRNSIRNFVATGRASTRTDVPMPPSRKTIPTDMFFEENEVHCHDDLFRKLYQSFLYTNEFACQA
jgi:hypothetical protein